MGLLHTGVRPERFLLETRLFLFVMDACAVQSKMHRFPAVAIPYVHASYQFYAMTTLLYLLLFISTIPLLCHNQGRQFCNLDAQVFDLILQISVIHDDRCIKVLLAPDLVILRTWTMCSILVWDFAELLRGPLTVVRSDRKGRGFFEGIRES